MGRRQSLLRRHSAPDSRGGSAMSAAARRARTRETWSVAARARLALFAVLPILTIAMGACAAAEEPQSQYALDFENAQTAVMTEGIKVYVFDAEQPKTDCQTLTASVRGGGVLPASPVRVFESEMFTPCALLANAPETH